MVEKEKLCRLAEVVFKETGELHITGQGTLKKVFLSAHLSDDAQKIYPPEEHWFFHKNIHTATDEKLIEKTSVYFILTPGEAKDYVRQWEEWLLMEAAARPVNFGEFGRFYFEDSLEFEAMSLFYYEWLPVLDYSKAAGNIRELPGKKLVRQTFEMTEDPVFSPVSERKKKKPAVMYAMWSLLLLLFLFSFSFWLKPLHVLFDSGPEINRKLVNVAPEYYDYPQDPDRYSDTETTSEHHLLGMENDEYLSERNDEAARSDESSNDGSQNNAITPEVKAEEWNIAEENLLCTLVVGGFAEKGNVSRMIQTLEAMDLKTVTMQGKSITLVGAKVDCEDHSRIAEIKNAIEPDAWMYHH